MTVVDKEAEASVAVIDDDPDIRDALRGLLRSVGLGVELFASVQEFLGTARPDLPGCLILDVRLPGRSGLDLQDELAKANLHLPVIFISGYADVPISVRAMMVVAGRLNKQIAAELRISDATVKVHRGQVMRKMRARPLAELVSMADKLASSRAKS